MPSTLKRESTSSILEDTLAPSKISHQWHGDWIWDRLVSKADKKTNDSKLQEISLQPNEKDKRNSSWDKEEKKFNWCKCESMEWDSEIIW